MRENLPAEPLVSPRFQVSAGLVMIPHALLAAILGFSSLIFLNPLTLLFAADDPHFTSVGAATLMLLKDAAPLIIAGPLTFATSAFLYWRGRYKGALVVSSVTIFVVAALNTARFIMVHGLL